MKTEEAIENLLSSITRGEKHIVQIKVDTALKGPLAIQYSLLRLLKNKDFDEKSLVRMVLVCGLAQISKTLLKELLSIKDVNIGMLKRIFGEFGKAI